MNSSTISDLVVRSSKYRDYSMFHLTDDLLLELVTLLMMIDQEKERAYIWPNNSTKILDLKTKDYMRWLDNSRKLKWKINAHVILTMMEDIEKLIEDNIEYIKPERRSKWLNLRDRASTMFVSIKLFELNKIDMF